MFTFGRKHEIDVAVRRHGGAERANMIVDIVDAIHDIIENKTTLDVVEKLIETALVEGRRDIWDAAGTWLLKLQKDYPPVEHVWTDLAKHPKSEVRFRIASHIIDLPQSTRDQVYSLLKDDKSKRVRDHARGKWDFAKHPEQYG